MSVQKVIGGNNYNQGGSAVTTTNTGTFSKLSVQVAPSAKSPEDYAYAQFTPRFEKVVATSGSPIVVSGVPTKEIHVMSYAIISDTQQNIKWQSNTNDLTGNMSVDARDILIAQSQYGLFHTASGQSLRLMPSSSGVVSGHITYTIM